MAQLAPADASKAQYWIDFETVAGTVNDAGSRKPIRFPINTESIMPNRSLSQTTVKDGDRNPRKPFRGNLNLGGDKTFPIDPKLIGYMNKAAIGSPTTLEIPTVDAKDGSPTVTIAGTVATFASEQAGAEVGDRIVYTVSGVRYNAWIKAITTPDTIFTVASTRDGVAAPTAAAVGSTVNYIVTQYGEASGDTVTIASGVATFSQAQTNAGIVVGSQIIYDVTNTIKFARVTAITSTTIMTVVDRSGQPAPDGSTLEVDSIESTTTYNHSFKIDSTADLASFTIIKGFPDLAVPSYELLIGCKINTLTYTIGGDGELTASASVIGSDYSESGTAYDSDAADNVADIFTDGFEQFDWAAKEGTPGSLSAVLFLEAFTLEINNNLDEAKGYTIGSQGVRQMLREGEAGISGTINALFTDTSLIGKSDAFTESALQLTATSGDNSLDLLVDQLVYEQNSAPIDGEGALDVDLSYVGYKGSDSTEGSAVTVTLINEHGAY